MGEIEIKHVDIMRNTKKHTIEGEYRRLSKGAYKKKDFTIQNKA